MMHFAFGKPFNFLVVLLTVLVLCVAIPSQQPCWAKRGGNATAQAVESVLTDQQQQRLTQWEQQLLGLTFIQEADARRIGRVEYAVFGAGIRGKTANLSYTQRIENLTNAIATTQPKYPTKLITALEQQQDKRVAPGDEIVFDGQPSKNPPLQNQEALDKLEKKLLGTAFVNDTVDNRLRRLEVKVFGADASQGDEAVSNQQRLDRLVAVAEANPRGGIQDLKLDRFLQEALPIILTSLLLVL